MTNKEWNAGIDYLKNAEVGDYVEHNGRKVIVENMCGGNYLCYDQSNEVVGLTTEVWKAMNFLRFGKLI